MKRHNTLKQKTFISPDIWNVVGLGWKRKEDWIFSFARQHQKSHMYILQNDWEIAVSNGNLAVSNGNSFNEPLFIFSMGRSAPRETIKQTLFVRGVFGTCTCSKQHLGKAPFSISLRAAFINCKQTPTASLKSLSWLSSFFLKSIVGVHC